MVFTAFRSKTVVFAAVFFLLGVMFTVGINAFDAGASMRTPFSGEERVEHAFPDRIASEQIKVYEDKVVIDVQGATFAPIKGTGSMEPQLHPQAHTLEVMPSSQGDIEVGDIISFYEESVNELIIHTVIETGVDKEGWFARTKGVNNPEADPWKVRFDMIEGVVIGVLY